MTSRAEFFQAMLAAFLAFNVPASAFAQPVQPGAQSGAKQGGATTFNYPRDYRVKPLDEQRAILLRHFPELREMGAAVSPLPRGAEGYFAIPRWEKIAPTYGDALERVFAALDVSRSGKFFNYQAGRIGADYLREDKRSRAMWERLAARQSADILVVPAQFGRLHRGQSVRRARESARENEFGLGAYQVAIMLLTHPERLATGDELWVYASGDEYSYRANGQFELAPIFYFRGGEVGFDVIWFGGAYAFYGAASGFVAR